MPKHKKSPEADKTLRAFYKACGLSPQIIEGAIRQRYETPTNFAGWQRSGEAARIARARRRASIENADGRPMPANSCRTKRGSPKLSIKKRKG
jgi:hypothetical protein